jgi:hypothetical protein
MPEPGSSNIEMAHHLSEYKAHFESLGNETVEMVEALVLAVVAVATAWSGYQAALWTGRQAERYGEASKLRVQAEGTAIAANQERDYIAASAVEWLKAEAQGEKKLAALFERRILPEFQPAFGAWKKTDPVHNPSAPPGLALMKEYKSSKTEEAAKLEDEANKIFEDGNQARQHSDDYVRVTVILATILLLAAMGQRFKVHKVRVTMMVLVTLLLCYPIYLILWLPRA